MAAKLAEVLILAGFSVAQHTQTDTAESFRTLQAEHSHLLDWASTMAAKLPELLILVGFSVAQHTQTDAVESFRTLHDGHSHRFDWALTIAAKLPELGMFAAAGSNCSLGLLEAGFGLGLSQATHVCWCGSFRIIQTSQAHLLAESAINSLKERTFGTSGVPSSNGFGSGNLNDEASARISSAG